MYTDGIPWLFISFWQSVAWSSVTKVRKQIWYSHGVAEIDKIVFDWEKTKGSAQWCVGREASNIRSAPGVSPRSNALLTYINDIIDFISCNTKLFADDLLIFQVLENNNYVANFQRNLDRSEKWARKWKMKFNVSKCNALVLGNKPNACDLENLKADRHWTKHGIGGKGEVHGSLDPQKSKMGHPHLRHNH